MIDPMSIVSALIHGWHAEGMSTYEIAKRLTNMQGSPVNTGTVNYVLTVSPYINLGLIKLVTGETWHTVTVLCPGERPDKLPKYIVGNATPRLCLTSINAPDNPGGWFIPAWHNQRFNFGVSNAEKCRTYRQLGEV